MMRLPALLQLALAVALTQAQNYVCQNASAPVVLTNMSTTASYVLKPGDPPNIACQTTKGKCGAQTNLLENKVILCHFDAKGVSGKAEYTTICIEDVAAPLHMRQHASDFCGCCGPVLETRNIPWYCRGKPQGGY